MHVHGLRAVRAIEDTFMVYGGSNGSPNQIAGHERRRGVTVVLGDRE
jgi:hypothetical protein